MIEAFIIYQRYFFINNGTESFDYAVALFLCERRTNTFCRESIRKQELLLYQAGLLQSLISLLHLFLRSGTHHLYNNGWAGLNYHVKRRCILPDPFTLGRRKRHTVIGWNFSFPDESYPGHKAIFSIVRAQR